MPIIQGVQEIKALGSWYTLSVWEVRRRPWSWKKNLKVGRAESGFFPGLKEIKPNKFGV
jgi:hypothetical protein